MNNLLPPNATAQEVALAGLTDRIDAVPVRTRQLWDPQTCPANLLPWLAWSLSVDEWNSEWTEQQKRDTIAASFQIHSTKGTIGAVRASLNALGYSVTLTEWWQLPAELSPYTFTVDVDTAENAVTQDIFNETKRVVDETKNTRSHLARLRVRTEQKAQAYVGAVTIYGTILEIFDSDTEYLSLLIAANRWHTAVNFTIPGNFE